MGPANENYLDQMDFHVEPNTPTVHRLTTRMRGLGAADCEWANATAAGPSPANALRLRAGDSRARNPFGDEVKDHQVLGARRELHYARPGGLIHEPSFTLCGDEREPRCGLSALRRMRAQLRGAELPPTRARPPAAISRTKTQFTVRRSVKIRPPSRPGKASAATRSSGTIASVATQRCARSPPPPSIHPPRLLARRRDHLIDAMYANRAGERTQRLAVPIVGFQRGATRTEPGAGTHPCAVARSSMPASKLWNLAARPEVRFGFGLGLPAS